VANGAKLFQGKGANFLCWRIRRGKLRIFLFQLDKPLEKTIIFGIADERIIEDMIMVVVFFDLPTEVEDLFFYLFAGHNLEKSRQQARGNRH